MATQGSTVRTGEKRGSMTARTGSDAKVLINFQGRQAIRDSWKKTLSQTQAKVTGGKLTKQEGLKALADFQEQYNKEGQDEWLSKEMGVAQPWADELAQEAKTGKLTEGAKKELTATLTKFEKQFGLAAKDLEAGETKARGDIDAGEKAAAGSLASGYSAARGEVGMAIEEEQDALTRITGAGGTLDKAKGEYGSAIDRAQKESSAAFDEARDVYAPWKTAGEGALGKFQEAMGMGEGGGDLGGVLANLPGFQFRMEQGLGAASRMQAARGGALGGRALQELQQVGQGVASEEFGRYLGGLSDLMGRGQQATGAISNIFAQEAGMAASFGEQRSRGALAFGELSAGFTERSVGRTGGLRSMTAGFYEQEGTNTANLRMSAALTRSSISQATAAGKSGLKTTMAGTVAGMEQAGQAAGTAMEFQTQMTGWQQTFQKQMAEWEASTTERIAKQQANAAMFTTLLGGAFKVGGAYAGRP